MTGVVDRLNDEEDEIVNDESLRGIREEIEKWAEASQLLVTASDNLRKCFGTQILLSLCSVTIYSIELLYQGINYMINSILLKIRQACRGVPLLGKGLPPCPPFYPFLGDLWPAAKKGVQIVPPSTPGSTTPPKSILWYPVCGYFSPPIGFHTADVACPVPFQPGSLDTHISNACFGAQYSVPDPSLKFHSLIHFFLYLNSFGLFFSFNLCFPTLPTISLLTISIRSIFVDLCCYIFLKIFILNAGQRAQNQAEELCRKLCALNNLCISEGKCLVPGAEAAACARCAAALARRLRAAPLRVRLLSSLTVQMALLADILAFVANYTIVLLQFNHGQVHWKKVKDIDSWDSLKFTSIHFQFPEKSMFLHFGENSNEWPYMLALKAEAGNFTTFYDMHLRHVVEDRAMGLKHVLSIHTQGKPRLIRDTWLFVVDRLNDEEDEIVNDESLRGIREEIEKWAEASQLLVTASDNLRKCFGTQILLSLCSVTIYSIELLYQGINYMINSAGNVNQ
ncbi:hypothetical protein MSG28_003202 [Choristoneura fumiferana]|uniref:Uncharacterized protein n=1 Tax=Choristoneura fumiferana TaxID=7141 RepID=A0ACC0KEL6_CHOFU|nr:hypothetical protein MSG28_003202 [Choristoneura fumiferana]